MKKTLNISKWTFAFLLLTLLAAPIFAAETCSLSMDGVPVSTTPYTYDGPTGEIQGKYYMDVLPEVKGARTYVPISTITKFLGASIDWQSPTVTINYNKTKLVLNIGESTALQNNETITLDAAPYLSQGRTMVPLRFISEALGCSVNYKDHNVDISFPALKVNNTPLTAVQYEYHMTMGSVILQSTNNISISRLHNALNALKTTKIATPNNGIRIDMDSENYYYQLGEFSFKASNDTISHYGLYTEWNFGMGTGNYALFDMTNDTWYSISSKQYYEIMELRNLGEWIEISNTVV